MTGQVGRWRQFHDHEDIQFFDEVSAHCSRCGGDVVLCTKSEYDWHKWQRHIGRCIRGGVGKRRGKGLRGKGKAVQVGTIFMTLLFNWGVSQCKNITKHLGRSQNPSSASEHLMQGVSMDVAHQSAQLPLSILHAKTRRHFDWRTTAEEPDLKHEDSVDVSITQYS